MLTVFADQHLFKIKEIMPDGIDLRLYDPEQGLPDQLDEADALLIRTVTDINKQVLPKIPQKLKFVGTGSAGKDHVDADFLQKHGVQFTHSAGCNARSVAEYVCTSLIIWSERNDIDLQNETIGIVGVGHVGTALQQMLDELGWNYKLFDPPRAEQEISFESIDLDELLNCSILTFHTPLYLSGEHATYHWLNEDILSDRKFKLIINTARGGILDENALMKSLDNGTVQDLIIDVWENEPLFNNRTAKNALIATPHIAGYSIQAKFRATKMIVDQMVEHFSLDLAVPSFQQKKEQINFTAKEIEHSSLPEILEKIHPLQNYQTELRKLIGLPADSKKKRFNRLRTSMPFRNEYSFLQLPDILFKRYPLLTLLGFTPSNDQ